MNEKKSVTRFREYLRIQAIHPNPLYGDTISYLLAQAAEIGLESQLTSVGGGNSVLVLTWRGSDPSLPSLLLNSHIDVVPVFEDSVPRYKSTRFADIYTKSKDSLLTKNPDGDRPAWERPVRECGAPFPTEHWKYPPFDAHKDAGGNIYARGSQDMKCVGSQYLEAVRRLKDEGRQFRRTVHMSFVPDEEIGGRHGMFTFAQSDEFRALNAGFAFDEGIANPGEEMIVYNCERSCVFFWFHINGDPGHGSRLLPNTAGEKLCKLTEKINEFRDAQTERERRGEELGHLISINITRLEGGVQFNVIPTRLSVGCDMRVTPNCNFTEVQAMLQSWADEAGKGVTIEYCEGQHFPEVTPVDETNPWWIGFSSAVLSHGVTLLNKTLIGSTDAAFVRQAGVSALGFSPMNNTPMLLHDHNEYLNEDVFLRGIDIYCSIISNLAELP